MKIIVELVNVRNTQDPKGYEVFRYLLDDFCGDRCPTEFSENAVTRAAVSEMQRRRSGRRRLSLFSLRRKSKDYGDTEVAEVVKEQGRRFRK